MPKYQRDFYVVAGKKLLPVVEETIKTYRAYQRGLTKLKKQYGFDRILSNSFGTETKVVAIGFPEGVEPDPTVWRRVYKNEVKGAYWPRKNTKAGREFLEKIEPYRRWDARTLQQAVGYKDLFWDNHFYPFNLGLDLKKKVAYFTVPTVPDGEEAPEGYYTPVPGVKKIKYAKLTEMLGRKP